MAASTPQTGLDLVISNILQQYPARMPLRAAAAYVSMSAAAAHTARVRGTFPLRCRNDASRLVVFTADLIDYLRTGESQAALSVAPRRKAWKIKTGRPTKREQLEAKRLGLTVRELRAQQPLALGGTEGGAA